MHRTGYSTRGVCEITTEEVRVRRVRLRGERLWIIGAVGVSAVAGAGCAGAEGDGASEAQSAPPAPLAEAPRVYEGERGVLLVETPEGLSVRRRTGAAESQPGDPTSEQVRLCQWASCDSVQQCMQQACELNGAPSCQRAADEWLSACALCSGAQTAAGCPYQVTACGPGDLSCVFRQLPLPKELGDFVPSGDRVLPHPASSPEGAAPGDGSATPRGGGSPPDGASRGAASSAPSTSGDQATNPGQQ